ncbi:MAG: branched chain amino acid aminotransferase [Chloroflexi bacterium]|nr:branched chain amino acid aminotransferase [Chloroflexota bacterium]MDC0047372.1 branched-chain amino acid transaminase [Chloroflexota bacterium]|tara:strand:- start:5031 stop:5963 length:933 start_codon:yes stop_codon:yes gene_type:complete
MNSSVAFFKGKFVPYENANLHITTHALHYGTSVFEGIRGNWNEDKKTLFVFRMKEHYDRLLEGCSMLMLDIPYTSEELCKITLELIEKNNFKEDIYIRPLAYKSEELVANLKLQDLASDFALVAVPFGLYIDSNRAINCCTSSWRRIEDTMIPTRCKIGGHYVNSILAKTEATLSGFDEAIFLTQDGYVSEGAGENLFLIKNNTIIIPPVSANNLSGITRDSVIKLATEELNLTVIEQNIRRSEIYLADELFLTGTAAHVTAVGSLDNRKIGSGDVGPITKSIQELYFDCVTGNKSKYINWCTAANLKKV